MEKNVKLLCIFVSAPLSEKISTQGTQMDGYGTWNLVPLM